MSEISADARSLGHTPLRQGRAFECSSCGRSGMAHPRATTGCFYVVGSILTERCS